MSRAVRPESRHFVYTYNNPVSPLVIPFPISYHVYGEETAPTTGTKHYQGYVILQKKKYLSTMIKKIPGVHIEIARGKPSQCSDYCKKEGKFVETGTLPHDNPGGEATKKKWSDIWDAAKAGDIEKIPADIRIRCYHQIKRIRQDSMTCAPTTDKLRNLWVHGPSGVGKSSTVRKLVPDPYLKMMNKWWDTYEGEDYVLLEDVDPSHAPWLGWFLKIWGDHYRFRAEVKGGSIMIRPKGIIVTSQYPISSVFTDAETRSAITRRFCGINYESSTWSSFAEEAIRTALS